MCHEAYRRRELDNIHNEWANPRVPLLYPEGKPNFAPLDGFRITDRVEIVRTATYTKLR